MRYALTLTEVREAAVKYHQITKAVVFVGGIEQAFVDLLNAIIEAKSGGQECDTR